MYQDSTEEEKKRFEFEAGRIFLQWSIEQAKVHPDLRMVDPDTLPGRILMVNFGAIHTTSFTVTHAIFDIDSSKKEFVDELRCDISDVLFSRGGEWSKAALNQMEKLDSIVRESLRLSMVSIFGVLRLVIGKEGFMTRWCIFPSNAREEHCERC